MSFVEFGLNGIEEVSAIRRPDQNTGSVDGMSFCETLWGIHILRAIAQKTTGNDQWAAFEAWIGSTERNALLSIGYKRYGLAFV